MAAKKKVKKTIQATGTKAKSDFGTTRDRTIHADSAEHLVDFDQTLQDIGKTSRGVAAGIDGLAQHTRGGTEYHRAVGGLVSSFANLRKLLDTFDRFADEYEHSHSGPL